MTAYYNENDPGAAAWLRCLISEGHIADGVVDERSILDVRASDLAGFRQCHFFAGIGGWSRALRLAGWPDDRPVWTGSPPCQPFSTAGKKLAQDDPRHLAPHFLGLVGFTAPPVLFGEQVASKDVLGRSARTVKRAADRAAGWAWFDDLCDRLEAAGYAVGANDLPAAGIGAPHERQRLFFGAVRLADADGIGDGRGARRNGPDGRDVGAFADPDGGDDRPGSAHGGWSDADWLYCRDGKWRPVEPGTFPLAHGVSARVGRLRGYGNAIVAQLAAEFVMAFDEVISPREARQL